MKTLYLIRHAKSSWKFPNLSDFERPLNERGKRDAPEMGRRLAQRGIHPDLMLSSPAKRALTTCQIIARQLAYQEAAIQTDHRVYHAGIEELLDVIRGIDDKVDTLCLFGHNPGFTDFANQLAKTDIYNIPTCGVFACTFRTDQWEDITFGSGVQSFYDYPKK